MLQTPGSHDSDSRQSQSCYDANASATDGVSLRELMQHAGDQGYEVTERQIERWHKEDCLPRPQLRHVPGMRGSLSTYPIAAAEQLVALCRLDESGKRLSLEEKRLMLWLRGYAIPPERIKQDIHGLISLDLNMLDRHTGAGSGIRLRDTLDVAERLAKLAWPHLQRLDLGKLLHQRLTSPADIHAYLVTAFQLLLGDSPAYSAGEDYVDLEDEPAEKSLEGIFIDVYGLKRAQTDSLGNLKPWLPRNLAPTLIKLARQRILSLATMRQVLEQATPDALEQARQDREVFFVQFFKLTRGMELVFGENAFGLGIFSVLEEMIKQSGTSMLALQVAGSLVIRHTEYHDTLDQFIASVRELLPAFERAQDLHAALERELPALAAAMRPDPEVVRRETNHAAHLQERLNRLQALAEEHREELASFRDRHPELFPELFANPSTVPLPPES